MYSALTLDASSALTFTPSSKDVYLSQPARRLSNPYPTPLEELDEFALYDYYTTLGSSCDSDEQHLQDHNLASAISETWDAAPIDTLDLTHSEAPEPSNYISRSQSATPGSFQSSFAFRSSAAAEGYRAHALELGLGLEAHISHLAAEENWNDHKRYTSVESSAYDSSAGSPLFSPTSMYDTLTPASLHSPSLSTFTIPPLKVHQIGSASTSTATPSPREVEASIFFEPLPNILETAVSHRFTEVTESIIRHRCARVAALSSVSDDAFNGQLGSPETFSDVAHATKPPSKRRVTAGSAGSNRTGSSRASVKEGLDCACAECGIPIAQLNFRGKTEATEVPVRAQYTCLDCSPVSEPETFSDDRFVCRYSDTVSGVVDQMQGIEEPVMSPASSTTPRRLRTSLSTQRDQKDSNYLHCDVCRMLVATGKLSPKHADDRIDFGVEAVCGYCSSMYSRCSDCGGGGGPRLGVGKWRCKQLFPDGRRTCTLSHLRLGSLDEMGYDCWRISDIPADNLEELVSYCEEVHTAAMLTALATPDALEAAGAFVTTHGQVDKIINDSWALFEPLIRNDIEPSTGRRRYIGLRWSTPIPRKKAKLNRAAAAKREQTEEEAGVLLRPGKKIVGFVLAELDLNEGSLCLPCIMPSGSVGDTFEATTHLLQRIATRSRADIATENSMRNLSNLPAYPDLREAWTMTMFLKDPRGTNHLEARRGFQSLDKYAALTGETDMSRFMFDRVGSFIPPELAGGWHILARQLEIDDDWVTLIKGGVGSNKRKASTSSTPVTALKKAKKTVKVVKPKDIEVAY